MIPKPKLTDEEVQRLLISFERKIKCIEERLDVLADLILIEKYRDCCSNLHQH